MLLSGLAVIVTVSLIFAPLAAGAQPAGKVARIGVVTEYSPEGSPRADAFRQGLREFGWVEGHNITIEWRWAQGKSERFPDLAAELISLKVDVIVASINPAVQAAQRKTKTIPIIMVYPTDPVALEFVASLARPGGNITGLTSQSPELAGKRLQLPKRIVDYRDPKSDDRGYRVS